MISASETFSASHTLIPNSPGFHAVDGVPVPLTLRLCSDTPSVVMRITAFVPHPSSSPTGAVGIVREIVNPRPSSVIGALISSWVVRGKSFVR